LRVNNVGLCWTAVLFVFVLCLQDTINTVKMIKDKQDLKYMVIVIRHIISLNISA